MESLPWKTTSLPLHNCLEDISSCDLYIGLFALRYGFVPEHGNPEHRSITELEYRHATVKGKDCLVFLLDEKFPWPPTYRDSYTGNGERGELIRLLRQELSKNKQVAFFGSPDDLASSVSAAVEVWEKNARSRRRRGAGMKVTVR
jgi:hypothetical protein